MSSHKTTTKQVEYNNNPSGKGGFGDHPDHRSPGGWKSENTISYQYKRYMSMSDTEFYACADEPDRTMAMVIAYNRVKKAKTSLQDVKEISDRTEGKAQQSIDLTSGGEAFEPVTVRIISEPPRDINTS